MINRYVNAVKRYLPKPLRADVAEELASLLLDKQEDAEQAKGARLDHQEMEKLLEDHGHPLKVAAAYQQDGVLISQELFPIYRRTLWYGALIVFVMFVIANIAREFTFVGEDIFIPPYSTTLSYLFCIITLIFFLMDKYHLKIDLNNHWKASSLPALHKPWASISVFESIISLLVTCLFLPVIFAIPESFEVEANETMHKVTLNAVLWRSIFVLKVCVIAGMLIGMVNLLSPYWTRPRLFTMAIINLGFTYVFFAPLLEPGFWQITPEFAGNASMGLVVANRSITIALVIAGSISLWEAGLQMYRASQR